MLGSEYFTYNTMVYQSKPLTDLATKNVVILQNTDGTHFTIYTTNLITKNVISKYYLSCMNGEVSVSLPDESIVAVTTKNVLL